MSRSITIPYGLLKVIDGHFFPCDYALSKPTLVFLYGPEDCSSCAIEKIVESSTDIEELQVNGKCSVLLLFSPGDGNQYEVLNKLLNTELSFPTYLDMECNFFNLNDKFPTDKRFHTFLLSVDGYPIFVGNPILTQSLHNLFERSLDVIVE